MVVTVSTYKKQRTFKDIDLVQFEHGKLVLYKPQRKKPVVSYYQYDLKFFCVLEDK